MRSIDRVIAGFLPYIPRAVVGRVARRYIAGKTMDDAIGAAKSLNAKGFRATMDILGEDVHRTDQAYTAAENYQKLLEEIDRQKVDSHVSIKLTQLGLKVDSPECMSLAETVVLKARGCSNFVRIDMEDSSCTSDTLEIYRRLQRRYTNVGVVLQAYLRRTADDVERLLAGLEVKPNIRLCKGVYVEADAVAYQDMAEIDQNYRKLLERLLRAGCYVGIATHDEHLVQDAQRLIAELQLPASAYEFQMLLGVSEKLRDRVLAAGHPLRVYIPFGRDWYAYSVRRLRENPRMAGYVLKALFTG